MSEQIIEVHVRLYNNNTPYALPKNYVGMMESNEVRTYVLPKTYAGILTSTDMNKINSGQTKYAIVRTVHKYGPERIYFDHKNFTWDLVLVRI